MVPSQQKRRMISNEGLPVSSNQSQFVSKLPDKLHYEENELENINAPYGCKFDSNGKAFHSFVLEFVSRVFDGDLCSTKEEAY